jgi:hypothetical protein
VAFSRRDDRSGLLDIHALSSVIDAQRRGATSAGSVALPSFGTPWALQEVRPPVPAVLAEPVKPAVMVGPDHRPLYVMIAALSVAVASLGAYVLMRPVPTVTIERTVMAAPLEPEAVAAPLEREAEREPEAAATPTPEAEAAPEPEAALEAAVERPKPARPTRPSSSATTSKPKPTPKAEPKDAGVIPVECVIDPSRCSKRGKPKPREAEDVAPAKEWPTAPSQSQIRDAMAVVKPQAKACRGRHGGKAGEKVRVKLSIVGSTGRVTSAQALDDHAGTAIGRCVADALSKAELPRFSKPQTGVVYTVTL